MGSLSYIKLKEELEDLTEELSFTFYLKKKSLLKPKKGWKPSKNITNQEVD